MKNKQKVIDRNKLVDIRDVIINTDLPKEERIKDYIRQIKNPESVIKIMKKEILITKEMLLVWNVRNVEEKNITKMGL